jgi:hypothetical protein
MQPVGEEDAQHGVVVQHIIVVVRAPPTIRIRVAVHYAQMCDKDENITHYTQNCVYIVNEKQKPYLSQKLKSE